MKLDLHVHTTASDGSVKPPRLVRMAAAAGIDVLAIADHDTTAGVVEAMTEVESSNSMRLVPAIEISCSGLAPDAADLHLLGYFVDPQHAALDEHAHRVALLREDRMRAMVERLVELGVDIDYGAVRAEAGSGAVLGRPHLARALVAAGAVPTVARAFELYLSDRAPAALPVQAVSPAAAVETVHRAGGIAVWAHPAADELARFIDAFREMGLDGVECIRARATPAEIERSVALTRARGLIPTGGSDWHGVWQGRLGDFTVRGEELPEFVELLRMRLSAA